MRWPHPIGFPLILLALVHAGGPELLANVRSDQLYANTQASMRQWMALPEQQTNYISALAGPSLALNSMEKVRAAAAAGDPKAQCLLGVALLYGWWGHPADPAQARPWLEKAAEKAIPEAQTALGVLLMSDNTISNRESQAVSLFEKAARSGAPLGQYYLAMSLHFGQGATADPVRARELYERAAQAGYAPAMCNLGLMLEAGLGGPPDVAKALELYRQSAIKAFPMGMHNLGVSYARGEGVPQDFAEALKWYRRAALLGYAPSMHNLANALLSGRGTAADLPEAARWFKQAIQAGVTDSLAPHAMLVLMQKAPGDPREAMADLEQSVVAGDLFGSFMLGSMFAHLADTNLNSLVAQDDARAASLLLAPAQAGNGLAQQSLGILYTDGRGVPKDQAEAFKWLTLAQRAGQRAAGTNLVALRATISPQDLAEGLRRVQAFKPVDPFSEPLPKRFLPGKAAN